MHAIDRDTLMRKLIFRSWHRGTKESDLLLGTFAKAHLAEFTYEQLLEYEALLERTDPEIFDWLQSPSLVPEEYNNDIFKLLSHFNIKR